MTTPTLSPDDELAYDMQVDLGLSIRAFNLLRRHEVRTAGDLLRLNIADIEEWRGVGGTMLRQIIAAQQALWQHGYRLKQAYHRGVVWGIRHPGPGPIGCPYCIDTLTQPAPETMPGA